MHQHFNSRPHGGRHFLIYLLRLLYHFNSRPHGGRQNIVDVSKNIRVISTHALTEGDYFPAILYFLRGISTHALTEGDSLQLESSALPEYFNSRPHGGRQESLPLIPKFCYISTHALTEGDPFPAYLWIKTPAFQLTPSRRATYECQLIIPKGTDFNSRPHGGRQIPGCCRKLFLNISTHALTEGDPASIQVIIAQGYFNSRPHGGRRLLTH